MDNDDNFVIINNSRKDKKSLGLLVDGPNMLRKEFCSDLEFVKNLLFDR